MLDSTIGLFRVIEEVNRHTIKVRCRYCGFVREYNTNYIKRSNVTCSKCVPNGRYGMFDILKKIKGSRVVVQCSRCRNVKEYGLTYFNKNRYKITCDMCSNKQKK